MAKKRNNSKNIVLQSLELLGKPAFLLFTIVVSTIYAIGLLSTKIIQSVKVPKIDVPSLKLPILKLPKITLPPLPKLKTPDPRLVSILAITVGLLALSWITYWYIFRGLPAVTTLTDSAPSLTTKIYDRNNVLLYQIYKNENRTLVKLGDLPKNVIYATLAAEDKNFYHHLGFDPQGIVRALYNNFINCKLKNIQNCTLEGGSTITQQLVKNVLLNREKSLTRKLKELVLAIETEKTYTKDQILEMYFNQVPYGGTAYGIEEASEEYFGKHATNLSLAEAALLAGLPVSPTALSPYGTNPYLSVARQHQVLDQMVENKYITQDERTQAENTPIVLNPQGISIKSPHFVMYVKDLLVKQYGEDLVSRGGLTVKTTLDLSTQDTLQNEINVELDRLKNLHVGNAAGMVVNPQNGDILAMVGSRDFFDSKIDGQVNITLQPRQPGSSIKPITYTLAFLNGLTPTSMIDDSPICFRMQGQPDWCPSNYDGHFHGTVTLRTALASSYNVPATKLLNSLGVMNMVNLARQMGITTWADPSRFGLSLTLGGGEVTMLDMTQVYSIFATGGYKIPITPIISVTDSNGNLLTPIASAPHLQIIPESIAFQINSILSDNNARSPAFGPNSVLNIKGKDVAVKTGTTNNLRDNWTFGYTPNLLVATWVGNNDNTPMSSVASGITGASPIWSRTITKLLNKSDNLAFTKPDNLVKIALCPTTKLPYCKNLCDTPPMYDYFVKGTEPKLSCDNTGTITSEAASISR